MTKKAINIFIIVLAVFFVGGIITTQFIKKSKDKELNESVFNEEEIIVIEDDEENQESGVPGYTKEELDKLHEEVSSNIGAKYDTEEAGELIIENLDVVTKFVPDEGRVLEEVLAAASNTVQWDLTKDTSAYIKEETMTYSDYTLKFEVYEMDTNKKLSDVECELYVLRERDEAANLPTFKVDNFIKLVEANDFKGDSSIYVYYRIQEEVLAEYSNVTNCYIDMASFRNENDILFFNVYETSTNKKLKEMTVDLRM